MSAIDNFEKKKKKECVEVEPGSVRAGREFTWFISIVDMDIISIKMLQENAGLLID